MGRLAFERLQHRVKIERVAIVHKFFAQSGDVHIRRNANGHVYGKHGRARMRGGIGAGGQIFDIDLAFGKKPREGVDDARMIERDHINRIGQQIAPGGPLAGALAENRQAKLALQFGQRIFDLGEGVPLAFDQEHRGEFAAEYRHAAVFDVAALLQDGLGEQVDDAGVVLAQGGDHEVGLLGCHVLSRQDSGVEGKAGSVTWGSGRPYKANAEATLSNLGSTVRPMVDAARATDRPGPQHRAARLIHPTAHQVS